MARGVGQGLRAKTAVSTSLRAGVAHQPRGLGERQAGVEHVVDDQRLRPDERALQVGAHLAPADDCPLVAVGGQPQGVEADDAARAGPGPGSGRRRTTGRRSAGRPPPSRRRCAGRSARPAPRRRSATSASEIRTVGSRSHQWCLLGGRRQRVGVGGSSGLASSALDGAGARPSRAAAGAWRRAPWALRGLGLGGAPRPCR